MHCLELDRLLYPYLDGELLPDEKLELEQHFAGCPACSRAVETERNALAIVRAAARAASPPAPAALKLKLLAGIHGQQQQAQRRRLLRWSAAAASVAICAIAANHQWRAFQRRLFLDDVTSRYARQFPLEIQQRAPHELEAWFGGKLNHRVSVPHFPNAIAAGARLLNVRENQAAFIRYDTQRPGEAAPRPLGLFVYQAAEDDVGPLKEADFGSGNGFNVVSWRDGDVVYRLVSDLDEQDVRQLLPESPPADVKPAALQR
ncbi:MAG: putative transrane anti-sigma factor [Myxococcaceae bacterium]|nr:putative transrane anti-sigma factor [Myxococcaceae bacterium]